MASSAYRTGIPELDRRITDLLDTALAEVPGNDNRDQLRRVLTTAVRMVTDGASRLDLKIAAAALEEMRDTYLMFGPHRGRRKVTIFGSARTGQDDPLYAATRDVAAALAEQGWMIITGAGPGIMSAGLEGAGRQNALGVNIRLPFESPANELVDAGNLVSMKYFFTRKLALIRESDGFVVMPGGFGTLDEAFELLTLLQTGKATPVPIVLLGLGQGYWHGWDTFVDMVVEQGYVSATDKALYKITNEVDEAVREVVGFYRNYHSLRWAGMDLLIRLQRAPNPERLAALDVEFADLVQGTAMTVVDPLPVERAERDHLELARVRLQPHRRKPGRLRQLIDALNADGDALY